MDVLESLTTELLIAVAVLTAVVLILLGQNVRLRRRVEERERLLLRNAKMASLGQMAGSIGHEINNPLTVILLSVYKLQEIAGSASTDRIELKEHLSVIEKTCIRVTKIIKGLKTVTREGTSDPFEAIAVNAVLDESLALCQERLRNRGVDVSVEGPVDQLMFWARPTQLIQVFLNLFSNALDALDGRSENKIRVLVEDIGTRVRVRVEDNGMGVPPEARDKLFKPFFTTKDSGHGTGLGLSLSQSILRNHGGDLRYEPLNPGTSFILEIPKPG